jgi:acyl-CoA thioesterase II
MSATLPTPTDLVREGTAWGSSGLRHDARVSFQSPTLADLVSTLQVEAIDDDNFVATQLDNSAHHIVGGHLAGQALMAASRTAPGRRPHSVHVYYLRAGDARRPVEFEVVRSRDGGTLATRQITARQDGEVLLEALASFSTPVDGLDYYTPGTDVPDPDSLPLFDVQMAPYAEEFGGYWIRPQPFDLRYVDPPPRLALELPEPSPRIRMWWRPTESVPNDEVLHSCLLTYLTGTTMLETAVAMRRATPMTVYNALIDHALWFHRPVDLSDWVLSDQSSPSGVDGRGLATANMYNRSGELVCIATQELYFGRTRTG